MTDSQPIRDPFALLGLPQAFKVSRAEIESAYLRRAATLHPDLSGLAPDESARASSELNDAKQVLLDAERRANTLLALAGGAGKADNKSLPDGFLMDIMEIRQNVEADLAGGLQDSKRAEWESWAETWRQNAIERVGALFDEAPADPTRLDSIRTELNAWRYIERLIEQLDPEYDPARADFDSSR